MSNTRNTKPNGNRPVPMPPMNMPTMCLFCCQSKKAGLQDNIAPAITWTALLIGGLPAVVPTCINHLSADATPIKQESTLVDPYTGKAMSIEGGHNTSSPAGPG